MKAKMRLVGVICGLVLCTVVRAAAGTCYVSVDGSDENQGTEEKPFRSIARARDFIREQRAVSPDQSPFTVYLKQGTYRLVDTVEFSDQDSHTRYETYADDTVEISGGVDLCLSDLKSLKIPAILERLPESVRDRVRVVPLDEYGFHEKREWPLRFRGYAGWPELYLEDTPLRLARWPDTGYATISKVIDRGSRPRYNETPDRGGVFSYSEPNPSQWSLDEDLYLGGYWCNKWYDEFIKVKSIDPETRIITMAAPHHYGLGGPSHGLYYAVNLPEELDKPGEYVFNRKNNILLLLPPSGASSNAVLQVSLMQEPLISIKGAHNIRFDGIHFVNTCGSAVRISDSDAVELVNCELRNISDTAVSINGGSSCGLNRCHLFNTGKTGVVLNGGDRQTLTPSKHYVRNCHIHHFARLVKTYSPAVRLNGVGQIVANNYLHDTAHTALLFGGNDHRIEYNRIERVCLDTSDAGAIYCGRDWTMGGTRIHGNFITGLGSAVHHMNWGIYLDDMASGIQVSGNVVLGAPGGILVGGGRNNIIKENVLVNCRAASILFDARATGWAGTHLKKPGGTMWERLWAVPVDQDPWNIRFPYLKRLEHEAPAEPRYNNVEGNLLYGCAKPSINALVEKHGTVADNLVLDVDPEISFTTGKVHSEKLNRYCFPVGPQ